MLSQVALFLVLLLSLRNMGVSEQDVSTAEAFAVFTFARLLSAIPITPGGVGVIDLGYIGGLSTIDRPEAAQIIAAVLIFRVLTYGIQIPLGRVTYFIWRAKTSWHRDTPRPDRSRRSSGPPRSGTDRAITYVGEGGAPPSDARSGTASRADRRINTSRISVRRAVTARATPVPSSTPATTSENQCAFR